MSYASVVGADAPVHWWRCADPGGLYLHDIGSSPQRPLLCSIIGQVGYTGPNSDGGSMCVTSADHCFNPEAFALGSPFSVECWFFSAFIPTAISHLLDKTGNLLLSATGTLQFQTGAGTVGAAAVVSSGAWHHAVGTYGPVGGIKTYLDGVNAATGAYGGVLATSPGVGLGNSPTNTNPYNGSLAEAAVYNVELTAARVLAHFNAGDNVNSRPVYRSSGTLNLATGVPILDTTNIGAVLAAVTKTY